MFIKTSDPGSIQSFLKKMYIPDEASHKGQNGKVLIVGGSSLFHAASIWAAETASYFVDMVHYASTKENDEIVLSLKKKFRNGMVVSQKEILTYAQEDDCILVGPGLVRGDIKDHEEARYTYDITKSLIEHFRDKRFVFDAGALQMMEKDWLYRFQTTPILTPHQKEFEKLFGEKISESSFEKKMKIVNRVAKKYHCVILLKAVSDIVSDGKDVFVVEGGNQGLTKGGTGDILAGLTVSLYAKNDGVSSAVLSSFLLKKAAERLFLKKRYWYNMTNIIDSIPETLVEVMKVARI